MSTSMYNADHEATLIAASILNESAQDIQARKLQERKQHDQKRMAEGLAKLRGWMSTFSSEDQISIRNSI